MAYLRKLKDKDGKSKEGWQININYIDPATGLRRRKTKIVHANKDKAEVVMADMIKKYSNGIPLASGDITLEEYLKLWLEEKKNNVAYRTWEAYSRIIYTHLIPSLGKLPIEDIKPYHVRKYISDKRKNGRIIGKGQLSERTLNYHYVTLNSALKQAVRDELIPKNPCFPVNPPRPKNKKRDMNVLTFKEVELLLAELKGHWLYPIVFLDINTGMRRGEICGLKWDDVNFFNNVITVRRSLYREGGEGLKEKETKRKSSDRAVDIGKNIKNMLHMMKNELDEIQNFSEGYNEAGYVFVMPNGDPIDPDYLTGKYTSFVKKIDIRKHTFHDLRHTHASLMLQSGGDDIMKVLQVRLGHASIKTTMDIYAHLQPGMQRKAAETLERKLKLLK